jgi:hypothetical protein
MFKAVHSIIVESPTRQILFEFNYDSVGFRLLKQTQSELKAAKKSRLQWLEKSYLTAGIDQDRRAIVYGLEKESSLLLVRYLQRRFGMFHINQLDLETLKISLPHGFKLMRRAPNIKAEEKRRAKILMKAARYHQPPQYQCINGVYKWYSGMRGSRRNIPSQAWSPYKSKKFVELRSYRQYHLCAFDFETRPSDSTPVMVCLTELLNVQAYGKYPCDTSLKTEIELVVDFYGELCHVRFFKFVHDWLKAKPPHTLVTVLGFNSSRFDNIFLAAAFQHMCEMEHVQFKYLEAKGRIIDIGFEIEGNRKCEFRDILIYFPVPSRSSLRNMAANFKLELQKGECSLDEMEYVGNGLLNSDAKMVADFIAVDPTFQRELEYCRQDTRVLFGLAQHLGKIFVSLDGPRKYFCEFSSDPIAAGLPFLSKQYEFAMTLPQAIPPLFTFLAWFITLPQLAIAFLPFGAPAKDLENVSIFEAISSMKNAWFLKKSIYGGRTLCGTIGQIQYDLSSTDICSEYPSAMNGPMPCGEPRFATLSWLNFVNRLLANDNLFSENFPFALVFPPFVAYIGFRKERDSIINRHDDNSGQHVSHQILPFVPYRKQSDAALNVVLATKTRDGAEVGNLEWLADTNGKWLYGVYNCVDIYAMRRLGFQVFILSNWLPIVWPTWSYSLGRLFSLLYMIKHQAKTKGDKDLEALAKMLLNSGIGKFGQAPMQNSDLAPGKDGTVIFSMRGYGRNNRTLYQLNSFCMSYSRLINQGHQNLIRKGTHIPDWQWDHEYVALKMNQNNFGAYPIYCDTDNLIFQYRDLESIRHLKQIILKRNLAPNPVLCTFHSTQFFFNFTLEFEEWHACTNNPSQDPPQSTALFFGKKSYIMRCNLCGALRTKAKGHNRQGIKSEDIANALLFPERPYRNPNLLLPVHDSSGGINAQMSTQRLFQFVYPTITPAQARSISSGARFTFKMNLPSSGTISIEPTYIERTYCMSIPQSQERCSTCFCLVHK